MGRPRIRKDLPERLNERRGTYYYEWLQDNKLQSVSLGRNKEAAIQEAQRLNKHKRISRLKILGAYRTACQQIYDAVTLRDGYKCVYCNAEKDLGLDHVIPFVKGGSNLVFNQVLCCADCNSQKNDSDFIVFMLKKNGCFEKIFQNIMNSFVNFE